MRRTKGPAFFGIGVDITEVYRIRRLCAGSPAFLGRCFTAGELAYCRKGKNVYERLAARFAAKEAVIKALDRRDLPLKSIEVSNTETGRPEVTIKAPGFSDFTVLVSLSHTSSCACASAAAFHKGRGRISGK